MIAVLYSSHQEIERINVENLSELVCMTGCLWAEDLIRVTTIDGLYHWCDSVEFEK